MGTDLLGVLGRVDSIENHSFLPRLDARSTVVDLGANTGFFTREIARRYGVRAYGVEANPNLCAELHDNETATFHNFAICDSNRPIRLNLSKDHTSSSILTRSVSEGDGEVSVEGVTFETFMARYGITQVDLLKVDIEGAEVQLFSSLSNAALHSITQISIEFHDDHGFIRREDFQQIHEKLLTAGFTGIKFAPNNTNWLYFRADRLKVSRLETTYIRHVVRNVRGVTRRLGFRSP